MREAVSLLIEFAARDLLASRLEIRCDARNARSAGVAESLGFTREGHIRNGLRDADWRDAGHASLRPDTG